MATKKKPTADELVSKKAPDAKKPSDVKKAPDAKKPSDVKKAPDAKKPSEPSPKDSPLVEVDWGKGFIEHKNAVVTGDTIQVPIPFNARRALGGTTKGRYAHVRVKLNAEEIRIGDRVFHKAPSETDPTLTFEILAKEKPN
jgi:hypothetical protein